MVQAARLIARIAAVTRAGSAKHRNEDAIGVAGRVSASVAGRAIEFHADIASPAVCVVADGAGGHPAGDRASRLVVNHVLGRSASLNSSEAMTDAITHTHLELHRTMEKDRHLVGMGSTVAVLALTPGAVFTGNVGDSEILEIDTKGLLPLSVADNPARPNWLPEAQPITGLTQMLGGPDEAARVEPHLGRYPLESGMRFLLCSDGLTDFLPEQRIDSLLRDSVDREADTIEALVEAAVSAGATDDISVVLAHVIERAGAPAQ